ncbi:MAG: pyrroline-5-carboxylate reductase, partial [Bacteroidaceae bacterium]|nr:pyrroline-5-carboxylate reductase [Bacteroidaceae bacterium]
MKIAIIGAGNMGGAIACGLAKGTIIKAEDISVSNPSQAKLDALKQEFPSMRVTNNNAEAVQGADIVLLAVKPWFIEQVVKELPLDEEKQMLVSVAAGISFAQFEEWVGEKMPVFRVIPNTAISQMESMTLIASHHATQEQEQLMQDIFNEMGLAMLIPEKQMAATTALTSCGIAYVLKYIQAAMQAGIELGVYPKDAQRMVAQSVKGAASLILNNDTHP